jgi:hypothetical protein
MHFNGGYLYLDFLYIEVSKKMFYVTIFHWNGFLNAKLYDHTRLGDSAVDKFRRNARKITILRLAGAITICPPWKYSRSYVRCRSATWRPPFSTPTVHCSPFSQFGRRS